MRRRIRITGEYRLSAYGPRGGGCFHTVDEAERQPSDRLSLEGGLADLNRMVRMFEGVPLGTKIRVTMEEI